MGKVKIYNKLGQLTGWLVVQVYSPDLKKAKKGCPEGADLVEFLKSRGFRFD